MGYDYHPLIELAIQEYKFYTNMTKTLKLLLGNPQVLWPLLKAMQTKELKATEKSMAT